MSVTLVVSKEGALFVEGQVSQMLTTVKNVRKWRKTEMDALRLSTWVAQKQTYGMNERSMVSRKDECLINNFRKRLISEIFKYKNSLRDLHEDSEIYIALIINFNLYPYNICEVLTLSLL